MFSRKSEVQTDVKRGTSKTRHTLYIFQAEFGKRIHLNSQFPGAERLPNTCNFSIWGPQLQGEEGAGWAAPGLARAIGGLVGGWGQVSPAGRSLRGSDHSC